MKIKIISYLKANWWMAMLSFFIPIIVLGYVYFKMGIYPGSQDRTILVSDAFSQYSNFHASFNNVLKGKQNIFYSWNASMGLNYWSFLSYYLGGIFTPLVFFFDNIQMADYLYYLTLLKIGSLGLSFWVFANQTFKIPKIAYVVLSICYALMSYVIAFSEILMWMDALMYLPLVILGIHQYKKYPAANFGVSKEAIDLFNALGKQENVYSFVFGNPYLISNFPDTKNLVICYEDDDLMQETALNFIRGNLVPKGTLPVTVSTQYHFGAGK